MMKRARNGVRKSDEKRQEEFGENKICNEKKSVALCRVLMCCTKECKEKSETLIRGKKKHFHFTLKL